MTRQKRKGSGKSTGTNRRGRTFVRDGGTSLSIPNSGLEVWLYDDSNRDTIRRADSSDDGFGGMPPRFEERTRQGLVVGYSLRQDDDLRITVFVGPPLTEDEMAVARWLEPQRAFLQLPSGRLCIESNDASRIGPEEPTDTGAVVEIPAGDYRVTLYRIDQEALDRERLTWQGPEEVIVLTPGGSPEDAATDLLPFEPRRDTDWIGKYSVRGKSADALVWFGDYWDTFIVNLDRAAVSALAMSPGSYIRTQVPAAGITLVSVFAESWDKAKRLPPPAGVELDEYGYCALCRMGDWDGAEALFCRRDTTKMRVEDEHHNIWLSALVEVLDVKAQELPQPGQMFAPTELRTKSYFDPGFLCLILSDVLPEVADMDELDMASALDMLDKRFAKMGLRPQGDMIYTDRVGVRSAEASCRLYTGPPDSFSVILAGEGIFELVFISELENGDWVVTGLADEIEGRIMSRGPDGIPVPHPRIHLQSMDESLSKIFAAHKKSLRKARASPLPAPKSLEEAVGALERFLAVAFGQHPS
ncbi:MAG TPA: hypothetical protein VFQ92_17720 [Blastocatellia bacterium]|nr:hypothetical protein [Blastocatellia bacterium]